MGVGKGFENCDCSSRCLGPQVEVMPGHPARFVRSNKFVTVAKKLECVVGAWGGVIA